MDSTGILIAKIFYSACLLATIFCVVKAEFVAKEIYRTYKNYWKLMEDSIPFLTMVVRFVNALGIMVFSFLLIKTF
jgi:hypothetical protein